ncbi:beta strand repeat-containing protein [Pseudoduganella sp. UC29_106]|uniref:beta strand repeat-containing protein n=1 Tax=Pseudoduganella sp. UC29_106 TaxID=3374553 RepID=UPI003757FA11
MAPQVVAGQAAFSQQGNVFSITNTPNTIINWQSFSIAPNEITRFIQQNADSKVLNRITGQDPTKILGSLQSNGQVFLINPNGVLFGKDARIDVNGLVASSLSLSNADFLAGKHNFKADGAAGKVENQGRITTPQGGQVFLIAPNVENSGIITSPKGEIILAAGQSVQLVDSANPSVQVVVSAPSDQALNLGQVVAQGGRIGIFGALVNQRGSVNADSAVMGENGTIVLKASGRTSLEAGSVTSARGAGKGGDIQILGKQVALTGDARVDASGAQGGGSVLVGGDYQGANPSVPNAKQTYVGKDAVISVDAVDNGDGGKVVVWGDDAASVHGTITARGGAAGGNGGFTETSAHTLDVAGLYVDAGAAHGKHGTWLLDPWDIEVNATGGGVVNDVLAFLNGATSGLTQIAVSALNLNADIVLQARNDLTISDALNLGTQGASVTALAGNHLNINAPITTNAGRIVLSANDAGAPATGSGVLTVGAALTSGGGAVSLSGANVNLNAALNAGAGNVTVASNKSGGKIMIGSTGSIASSTSTNVPLVQLTADQMDLTGGITGGADVWLAPLTAGTSIGVRTTKTGTGLEFTPTELAGITARNLDIGNMNAGGLEVAGAVTLANVDALALASRGNLDVSAGVTLSRTGGAISAVAYDPTGAVNLNSGAALAADHVAIQGDHVSINSGASISTGAASDASVSIDPYTSASAIRIGASKTGATGTLELTGAELGRVTTQRLTVGTGTVHTGSVTVDGDLNLNNGATGTGLFALGGSSIALNGKVTAAGDLALQGTGAITQTGEITAGSLYVTGTSITLNANNVVGGVAAQSSSGDITLGAANGVGLTHTSTQAGLNGMNFGGISTSGDVTLNVGGLIQDTNAPISAPKLTINATGDVSLYARESNRVASLTAENVGSLQYLGSGSTTVESVSITSNSHSEASISIRADDLAVKNVDARGQYLHLNGGTVSLASNASVKGGNVYVTAEGGSLTTASGSKMEGNWISLRGDSMNLGGDIKANTYTGTNVAGQVTLGTYSGGTITLGDPQASPSGLALSNAELRKISAYTIFVDGNGSYGNGYGNYGGAIFLDNLALTNELLTGRLRVNGSSIDLSRSIALGSAILNLETSGTVTINGPVSAQAVEIDANTLTNAGMITAKSVDMKAYRFALSGATGAGINADNGAGTVSIYSSGSIGLGGANAVTGAGAPNSFIGDAALASISAAKLKIESNDAMAVTGAMSSPAQNLELLAHGSDGLTIGANVTGKDSVYLKAWYTLTNNGLVSAKAVEVDANRLALSGATGTGINANNGAGTVSIYSNGTIGLGGANAATGAGAPDSFLGDAALTSISAGKLTIGSAGALAVTGAINRPGQVLELESNGVAGLSIGANVTAKVVNLIGNTIDITGTVNADIASLQPSSSGYEIAVGGACSAAGSCLSLTQLNKVQAQTVGIGSSEDYSGAIRVVDTTGLSATTTRLGLLTTGGITQTGVITVQELGIEAGQPVLLTMANNVGKLAANVSNDLTFKSAGDLSVARLTGTGYNGETVYDLNGIASATNISLDVGGSLSRSDGVIKANNLDISAAGSIGSTGAPLLTAVSTLSAESRATTGTMPIVITNNKAGYSNALSIRKLRIAGGNGGAITVDNYGATTIEATTDHSPTVWTSTGDITITAHSPLTVRGKVLSTAGSITLEAGSTGSASDDLTIESTGEVMTTTGNIRLVAGDQIVRQSGATVTATGGTVTSVSDTNTPPPVEPPPVTPPPVTPPPVTPPPVTPPPVTPPPVTPPPVTPPPVTPPVEPPPVTPPVVTPPVEPPVVTPPVVTPPTPPVEPPVVTPPVTPPVTIPSSPDVCAIAPSQPLCQVLSPPTASEPVKPVQVAQSQVIRTINNTEMHSPTSSSSSSSGGGTGGNSSTSSTPDDKKIEAKAAADASKDKEGTKNDPVKKTYCN